MKPSGQKFGALSGLAYGVCVGLCLILAGFIPPPAPSLSAEQVAELYRQHSVSLIIAMIIGMTGSLFYLPFTAAISTKMRNMKGISHMPIYLQLGSGSAGMLMFLLPFMMFALTAFRPDRDPQLTMLMNDASWLFLLTPFPTFVAQNIAIAQGILADKSERPVFPRWLAFFNIWVAVGLMPASLAFLFKVGPFAWNGLFPFWIPAIVFFGWIGVMSVMLLRPDVSANSQGS